VRLVACCGGDFGLPALSRLQETGHQLLRMVTPPSRPAGRGRRPNPSRAETWAVERGVEVLPAVDVNECEVVSVIEQDRPDLLFVADFGQILKKPLLQIPRLGAINLHASLLPDLRGAEPIRRAILAGYDTTGITIILMDTGIDTGSIITSAPCRLLPDDNYASLKKRLALLGADTIVESLKDLELGKTQPRIQDEHAVTQAAKLTKAERQINWESPALDISRLIRALTPAPGAWTMRRDKRLLLWRAHHQLSDHQDAPGTVMSVAPLTLASGLGRLIIDELQPEGKRRMSAAEFIRGYRAVAGEKWGC